MVPVLVLIPVLVLLSLVSTAGTVEAVPAFARQTGYTCGECHTIQPRLREVGTMFKMGGYRLTGEDLDTLALDDGAIVRSLQLAGRLLGTPYSKRNGRAAQVDPLDELRLYFGGRITDQIGIFAQTNLLTDGRATTSWIRAAFATHVTPDVEIGIQGGRSSAAGGDPFDGLQRMMAWTQDRNIISSSAGSAGSGLVDMHSAGRGFTGHAFIHDAVYLGLGLYDVERRASGPVPKDVFARVVVLPPIGSSYTHIGGFHYRSDEFERTAGGLTGTSKGSRTGFDLGSQWPLSEHLVLDLIGLVVRAKEVVHVTGAAPLDVGHGGYQVAASLVYRHRLAGALGYGRYKYDDTNPFGGAAVAGRVNSNLNLNLTYMLRSNARLSLDLTRQTRGSDTTNLVRVSYDFGF
ncbi:MAG: hypothetical protein HY560_04710 [Gemmatimonadetes bacterium]|nr:hypothetical protein [Gemmatimonadota bacterium]